MRNKIILFFLMFILWTILNWAIDWQYALVGIIASIFVVYVTGDFFYLKSFSLAKNISRILWFLYYVSVVMIEFVKANARLIYPVIFSDLYMESCVINVRIHLKSDMALAFLANAVTMSSATLSMDVDKDKGLLLVSWYGKEPKNAEAKIKAMIERYEGLLRKVFE